MNPRERMLALGVLLVVVLAGGAFLFHQLFFVPLQEREASIQALQQDIDKKQERIFQVEADRPKLERWKQLSLPADVDMARLNYEKYLSELMLDSGFAAGTFSVTAKQADAKSSPQINKEPIYTKLDFTAAGHGKLENLVTFLEQFYQTGLLQQVKNIQVLRPLTPGPQQQQNELDINLTVEALVVAGAERRSTLLQVLDNRLAAVYGAMALRGGLAGLALVPAVTGPTGPVGPGTLAQPKRSYAAIARKNIFYGETDQRPIEEVEVTQFVHLTDISQNHKRWEAWLYDRLNNRRQRLRSEPGFNSFRVLDEKGETAVRGVVIRIDSRDLIFRVDSNYYSIHVGQSLDEAMKASLTMEQRKARGLATPQTTAKKE
jgi:hypothetical protein